MREHETLLRVIEDWVCDDGYEKCDYPMLVDAILAAYGGMTPQQVRKLRETLKEAFEVFGEIWVDSEAPDYFEPAQREEWQRAIACAETMQTVLKATEPSHAEEGPAS